MPMLSLACPACRSDEVETLLDLPMIAMCKCRTCATSFTVSKPSPAAAEVDNLHSYDGRPMPWRCPACHLPIQHSEFERKPRLLSKYRCHICRLELVLDEVTDKLTVAPLTGEDGGPKK